MTDLRRELLGFIESPDLERFDDLALRVARHQARGIPAYGKWVAHHGGFDHWRDAPWVPTEAFRTFDFCESAPTVGDAVFETSGTTTGTPGRRRAPDLSLYHAGMVGPFLDALLDGDTVKRPWISLIPTAQELPSSSLAHMVSGLAAHYADLETSSCHLDTSGLDVSGAMSALHALERPGLVLATSFALINLLDAWSGPDVELPHGTRLMLTGGFKGRSRALDPSSLETLIGERLGLPANAIIGEYGMTEWTSQAYGSGVLPALVAPPWLQIRVIDPVTLQDQGPGVAGLVASFDLLNLDNVSAVLTTDIGALDAQGRLSLLGRAPSARPRGCGLTALDWGTRP